MKLDVLFEDNHIIAVNKRSGDLVQGDKTGDKPLSDMVKEYIKEKYNKPGDVYLGVTHRIDRPTSGIVIFARTSKALTRLNKMFQDKEINKTYWAVVEK
ncbi:pseudouridine synthase, partial [bacterium]|nr:pseudouridine synthase [bacterium]